MRLIDDSNSDAWGPRGAGAVRVALIPGDLQLMAETKTGAPNIQDVFLNYARREKLPVTIHLLDGREFDARIKNFDRFALIVEHGGMDHLIFKHAIATIRTPRSVPNYFSSHHP
jgi:host factor-I protein